MINLESQVFEFNDYKLFLKNYILRKKVHTIALKTKLAQAARCHSAYFSQVLNGDSHLSPEQADLLSNFIFNDPSESEYFLLLVFYARASSPSLRSRLKKKLHSLALDHQKISARIERELKSKSKTEIIPNDYFSSWHFAAVHTALSIPQLRNPQSLMSHLKISSGRLQKILDFLYQAHLVSKNSDFYEANEISFHIEENSTQLPLFLKNLMLLSQILIEEKKRENFNYSGFITLSQDDFDTIKEKLISTLKECIEITKSSKPEKLCLLNLNAFQLSSD